MVLNWRLYFRRGGGEDEKRSETADLAKTEMHLASGLRPTLKKAMVDASTIESRDFSQALALCLNQFAVRRIGLIRGSGD